jgi:hypothetical protein
VAYLADGSFEHAAVVFFVLQALFRMVSKRKMEW